MTLKKYSENEFRASWKQRKIIDFFPSNSTALKDLENDADSQSSTKRKAELPLYVPNKREKPSRGKIREECSVYEEREALRITEFPNNIESLCLLLDRMPRSESCLRTEPSRYPTMTPHESDMISLLLDNNQQHFLHAVDRAYSFRAVMPPDLLSKFVKIVFKDDCNENEQCCSKLFAYINRCIRLKSPRWPANRSFWRDFIVSVTETNDSSNQLSIGEKLAGLLENLHVVTNFKSNVIFMLFIVLSEIVVSDFDKFKYCTHLDVHNVNDCPVSADLVWVDLASKRVIPRIALKLIRVLSSFLNSEDFGLKLASSNLLRVLLKTLELTLSRERLVEVLSQSRMENLINYCK